MLARLAVRRRLLGPDHIALHLDDGLARLLYSDVEAVARKRHDFFLEDEGVEPRLGEVIPENTDFLVDGREHGSGAHGGGGHFVRRRGGGGGLGVVGEIVSAF